VLVKGLAPARLPAFRTSRHNGFQRRWRGSNFRIRVLPVSP
jgi:hypothetical protein